jgi:hypothetical protein
LSFCLVSQTLSNAGNALNAHIYHVLRWIKVFRYAVRAKVAQLMAAGGVAAGLAGLGATDLSLMDAVVLLGIMTGSVGGSLSLWWAPQRAWTALWLCCCVVP